MVWLRTRLSSQRTGLAGADYVTGANPVQKNTNKPRLLKLLIIKAAKSTNRQRPVKQHKTNPVRNNGSYAQKK